MLTVVVITTRKVKPQPWYVNTFSLKSWWMSLCFHQPCKKKTYRIAPTLRRMLTPLNWSLNHLCSNDVCETYQQYRLVGTCHQLDDREDKLYWIKENNEIMYHSVPSPNPHRRVCYDRKKTATWKSLPRNGQWWEVPADQHSGDPIRIRTSVCDLELGRGCSERCWT